MESHTENINEYGQDGLRALYNKISEVKYDFRNYNLYRLIIRYLSGRSVLDIGCGPGHFIIMAQNHGHKVTGIEPDPQLISLGKDIYSEDNLNIHCTKVENLNLDQKFDTITMIDVLEHVKHDQEVLTNLKKYLSDSGKLIIVTPAHPYLYGIRDRSIGHFRRYAKRQIIHLVENSGMKILKIHHWNALGVVPFFVTEKILRRPLHVGFRGHRQQKGLFAFLNTLLFFWFQYVENTFNFRFGLSLICVAEVNKESF